MSARLRILAAGPLVALLAGCAGYQVGPTNGTVAGSRSVEVALFANHTLEPRLSEPIAQALRKRLQQDGTFHLDTQGNADVLVTGDIKSFVRNPLSFQRTDIITTRDYDELVTVHVKAVERGSGKVLLERDVTGRSTIQSNADLGSAEREAAPLVAESIARQVTDLLADGTW
ncbi:MAG TPA: LPS assembly lipoprotein LptE [Candidatus Limnocylindria bacterium]|nr:LPS assembly lipoprotein LptE [Candidatus Limnocylindria bacterium]